MKNIKLIGMLKVNTWSQSLALPRNAFAVYDDREAMQLSTILLATIYHHTASFNV